jgi:hypothetical protein
MPRRGLINAQMTKLITFHVAKKFMLEHGRAPTSGEMAKRLGVCRLTAYRRMVEIDGATGLPFRFLFGAGCNNFWQSSEDHTYTRSVRNDSYGRWTFDNINCDTVPVDTFFHRMGAA